jgi:metal-dependent amidase/aminoacylase/carboxypeptidase family protein
VFCDEGWATIPNPIMGAEDFSYVLNRTPGARAFLGAAPEGGDWRACCPLHSNRMVIDERVMARGVAMHCAMAQAFLNGEPVL